MAREVYADELFIEFSRKFVFMRVLADRDPEGAELQKRYRVEGIPTLLILDSEGREIDRIVGARPVEGLIEELELILEYGSESSPLRL
ncbi:MAG: thioredoxin family protein [Acidobacteria bacterium]|nr:thioredoxin family protein [Acidobacteriota bacterium]